MSKNAVLFAIEAAKVVQILLNAKKQAFITCKNLLTKRTLRLKKSETPIHKGIAATLHLQTTRLHIVNHPYSPRKRVV